MSVAEDVLAVLVEAAKAGLPTPTNDQLATRVGAKKSSVRRAIEHTLADIIVVESRGGRRTISVMDGEWVRTSPTEADFCKHPGRAAARTARRKRVCEYVRSLAAAGAPMQSNEVIARALSCAEQTIANDLEAMVGAGVLSIESRAGRRRVVFPDTGEETRWTLAATRHKTVARKKQEPVEVNVEAPPLATLLPCARVGCAGAADLGRAYCAAHEAAEVLEWPVVALDLAQEDIAA